MWLAFAAPARFFCLESASQVVVASFWHLVMKLLSAAPASFLSAASDLQVANAGADETRQMASANAIFLIVSSLEDPRQERAVTTLVQVTKLEKRACVGWFASRAVINCAFQFADRV